LTTAEKDEKRLAWGTNDDGVTKSWNSGGWQGDGQGWGNEFCPVDCVNDCAEFKLGGFLSCGMNLGRGWFGYSGSGSQNHNNNEAGPNSHCPQNVISGTGHQAWTWCGEKKVRCKQSADTKKRIKDAKAAKKAAKAALKLAKQAFQDAKGELELALSDAAEECA
jgi:hypothetical protein